MKSQADPKEHIESSMLMVTKSFFQDRRQIGETEVRNEPFAVHRFLTEPAKVGVTMGLTLNLGNFESARIDVSLSVPCYREETESAYGFARDWVENKIQDEVKIIRQAKRNIF